VEQQPDGFRISLPRLGLFRVAAIEWLFLGMIAFVCGWFVWFAFVAWSTNTAFGIIWTSFCVTFLALGAYLGALLLSRVTSRAVITVSREQLRIAIHGPLGTRRFGCRPSQVTGIGVGFHLCILSGQQTRQFFGERDREELQWLARVLREGLGVPEHPLPGPDEITVAFALGGWEETKRGFLRVVPGEMLLRHPFYPGFYYRFRAGVESIVRLRRTILPGTSVTLGPSDASCWVGPDGRSALQIKPTGTRLVLTVWDDGQEALPRALARFWGSKEG
jgi:hypothetical protein